MNNKPLLYLFSEEGAYGEFIEIVSAYNKEQAWAISYAKKNGWNNNPIIIEPTLVSSIIFKGGYRLAVSL
jgi:hypothetical protein